MVQYLGFSFVYVYHTLFGSFITPNVVKIPGTCVMMHNLCWSPTLGYSKVVLCLLDGNPTSKCLDGYACFIFQIYSIHYTFMGPLSLCYLQEFWILVAYSQKHSYSLLIHSTSRFLTQIAYNTLSLVDCWGES